MSNENAEIQMAVGILIMGIIVTLIIYFLFPTGQSDAVKFPQFNFGGISGNLGNGILGDGILGDGTNSGSTGPTGTGPTGPVPVGLPANCQLRCQSASECPPGLGCVDGICRCQSTLGGVCRKPGDCNCRLGIKCSLPEQKCVPNNFYYDFGEAAENCPTGVRRGYFYDPYIMMMDGTRGDYQSGYRCV